MPEEVLQNAITKEEIGGNATSASSALPPRNACEQAHPFVYLSLTLK